MEIVIWVVLVAVLLIAIGIGLIVARPRGTGRAVLVEPPAEAAPGVAVPERAAAPPSFRERLGKTRSVLGGYLTGIRTRSVDAQTWDQLEEALLRADVGVAVTQQVLGNLRKVTADEGVRAPEEVLDRLRSELKAVLATDDRGLHIVAGVPNVWLFVGVNGVGKTTTIGKIAHREIEAGRSVVMAAADTFRAAATEQLTTWAERTGADIVRGGEGGDPSAVVYDAVQRAAARGNDLVLADTAGRFHTKANLMEELRKVRRVADRDPGQVTEVLLVLDATTGQNARNQVETFKAMVDISGLVVTKLDGTARGGVVVALARQFGLPVVALGVGEGIEDLCPFEANAFAQALLGLDAA